MLRVLIKGASNEYPQHMFSFRNKKDISSFRMKKSALSVAMYLPQVVRQTGLRK